MSLRSVCNLIWNHACSRCFPYVLSFQGLWMSTTPHKCDQYCQYWPSLNIGWSNGIENPSCQHLQRKQIKSETTLPQTNMENPHERATISDSFFLEASHRCCTSQKCWLVINKPMSREAGVPESTICRRFARETIYVSFYSRMLNK